MNGSYSAGTLNDEQQPFYSDFKPDIAVPSYKISIDQRLSDPVYVLDGCLKVIFMG